MSSNKPEQPLYEAQPQNLLLWSIVLLVAFSWIFWDFLQRQFWFAIKQQADWGHTLVIPFIAGYFVWLCRGKILQQPFSRAWSGIVFVLFGLAFYIFCALSDSFHHHNLMGLGVASSLTGMVIFIFGWRPMKYLWFPLLYLFIFGQTISDRFMEVATFKLQDIASYGSYVGFSILGFDIVREGNTLELFYNNKSYPLNIAEACSGMRMLMAFFALGVAMAYTGLRYTWQRIVLVLFALPTAIFVNILRVMTLGLLSIIDSGFAAGDFHTFVGTVWLIPAFLIYLGIVWILKNLVIEPEEDEPDESASIFLFTNKVTSGFLIAVVVLAVTAIGFQYSIQVLNVTLKKEAVYPRRSLSVLPTQLNGWKMNGEDQRMDAAGVEALGTELYLSRSFVNTNHSSSPIKLHITYYTGQIDAVPHVPDRCMVANGFVQLTPDPLTFPLQIDKAEWQDDTQASLDGVPYQIMSEWNPLTKQEDIVRLPFGDFELRTTEFTHPQMGNDHVFAGYFFIANGKTTPYPGKIRFLSFDRSSKYAYYCKIQFTMQGNSDFTTPQFVETVSEFTSQMLPHIMKCLPDWAEVTNNDNQNQ
ncbi:MAG: exosortase/archaeosortase family protein [Phycisphaerae bacterium]|jgi:exosortase|nr:exosortase/archaeosortase family protein [Phycisphaerae bacterium]